MDHSTDNAERVDVVEDMPLDFVVFDLETTGLSTDSAEICEIAALRVEAGEVADSFETLVHVDGKMPRAASEKNNITDDMLADAPHVAEALGGFLEFIGTDAVLVGHKIDSFDLPILKRVAELCRLPLAYASTVDTLPLAKKAWPDKPRYSMDYLREELGLSEEGAHRALKDCYDELDVYLAIHDDVAAGRATLDGGQSTSHGKPKNSDFIPASTNVDEAHPFFRKEVVITGTLDGMTRKEARRAISDLGGISKGKLTKKTDYLVVGSEPGGTLDEAEKSRAAGQAIRIIGQDEFRKLLGQKSAQMVASERLTYDDGWIIACPLGSNEEGDSTLYIGRFGHTGPTEGKLPRRPNDGSKRDTVAAGWLSDVPSLSSFAAQPWYEWRRRVGRVEVVESWRPRNGKYLFDGLMNCREFNLLHLDTSLCTSLEGMFRGCTSVQTLFDVDGFDTSSVTNVSYMFMNCLALRAVSIVGWDTSTIVMTDYMLSGCSSYVLAGEGQEAFLDKIAGMGSERGIWKRTNR